jgi:hypothetical protein
MAQRLAKALSAELFKQPDFNRGELLQDASDANRFAAANLRPDGSELTQKITKWWGALRRRLDESWDAVIDVHSFPSSHYPGPLYFLAEDGDMEYALRVGELLGVQVIRGGENAIILEVARIMRARGESVHTLLVEFNEVLTPKERESWAVKLADALRRAL